MANENKMGPNVYKTIIEFVLCWPTTARHGAYPEVWLIQLVRLHWRKLHWKSIQFSVVK